MHSSKTVCVLALVAILLGVSVSHAFDGNRRGFILGGGIGAGLTSFSQEVDSPIFGKLETDRENKFALVTDFRLGGGFTEKFMLYYANKVAWFGMDSAAGKSVTIAHGIGLVGASYYFNVAAPSMYLVGSIGLSSWSAPFESDSESWSGFGITGGVGYEFATHWSVEGTLNWGNPGKGEFTTNAFSVLVTVNGLAY
jgi:hypothetical protein